MNKHYALEAARELVGELCRLIDAGKTMSPDEFHELCEQERFIDALFIQYKDGSMLEDYLNKQSPLCKHEVLAFWNDALSRHANVALMEEFGLKRNALLFGVNLCLAVVRELER
jgi:hypothetical protein